MIHSLQKRRSLTSLAHWRAFDNSPQAMDIRPYAMDISPQAMRISPQAIDDESQVVPGTPPPVRAAVASVKTKYLETLRLLLGLVAGITNGCERWSVLLVDLEESCSNTLPQKCQSVSLRAGQLSLIVQREIDQLKSVVNRKPAIFVDSLLLSRVNDGCISALYAEYKELKRLFEETDLELRNVRAIKRKLESPLTSQPKRANTSSSGSVEIPNVSTAGATEVAAAPVSTQRVNGC